MEEFWEGSPAYPLLRELGLDLVEDRAHSSVVLHQQLLPYRGEGDRDAYLSGMFNRQECGAWLRWNDHVGGLLSRLRIGGAEPSERPWASPLMAGRFSTYVREQVREPRVRDWIRVVLESETAIEWDRMSVLDGVTELQPFLDSPAGFGETNFHVAGGNQQLIDALVRQLPDGTVWTDEPVSSVRDVGHQVVVRHGRGRNLGVLRCDHVVLAVPLWSLNAIALEAELEPDAREAIRTCTAGTYVKVQHRLRPEAARLWERHGDGLFTLLSDSPAGCIYLGEAREGSDLVLTQLIHAQHARQLCALPREEIARRAVRALDQLSAPRPAVAGAGSAGHGDAGLRLSACRRLLVRRPGSVALRRPGRGPAQTPGSGPLQQRHAGEQPFRWRGPDRSAGGPDLVRTPRGCPRALDGGEVRTCLPSSRRHHRISSP